MTRPDLSWITASYFDDFDDPHVINDGWCFVWAWLAHLAHPGAQLATVNRGGILAALRGGLVPGHAIVRIDGRWYDSRSCRGRARWRQMPEIAGHDAWGFTEQSPEAFRADWDHGRTEPWASQGIAPWPSVLPDPAEARVLRELWQATQTRTAVRQMEAAEARGA